MIGGRCVKVDGAMNVPVCFYFFYAVTAVAQEVFCYFGLLIMRLVVSLRSQLGFFVVSEKLTKI